MAASHSHSDAHAAKDVSNQTNQQPDSKHDAIGDFIAQMNAVPAQKQTTDQTCAPLYKHSQKAESLSTKLFDECFKGQVDAQGRARKLDVPLLRDEELHNKPGQIGREKITTTNETKDSKMLNVYMHAKDSVLGVEARGGDDKVKAKGTAFIVKDNGLLATDYHCIEDGNRDNLYITMGDGTKRKATVVGEDRGADLALLKIQPQPGDNLKALPLGNSEAFQANERLPAIGNAWDKGINALSPAKYSGLDHQYDLNMKEQPAYVNWNRSLVRTDASVAPGQSGGPMLRLDGSVAAVVGYSDVSTRLWGTPVERLKELMRKVEKSQN